VGSLRIAVIDAAPVAAAAAPLLGLTLEIRAGGAPVAGILLRCQVRLAVQRRAYGDGERARLADLFGEGEIWSRALRPMHWATVPALVPAFDEVGQVVVELPCGLDLSAAASRYCDALDGGAIPLDLMFSGTIFLRRDDGSLEVAPVAWSQEASFDLPVATFRDAVRHHHGDAVFVALPRALADRLVRYRSAAGLASIEQALARLLPDDGGARGAA
jgi:hypothetical protein